MDVGLSSLVSDGIRRVRAVQFLLARCRCLIGRMAEMGTNAFRLASFLVVAVLALLASAGVASADPGSGAQVSRTSECQTFPIGGTICSDFLVVFNVTQTGSGLTSVSGAATVRSTYGGAFCTETDTVVQTFHSLIGASEENNFLYRLRQNFDDPHCFQFSCVLEQHVHAVNGAIQFFRQPDIVCTDPIPPTQ